jgi:hypothetical protein
VEPDDPIVFFAEMRMAPDGLDMFAFQKPVSVTSEIFPPISKIEPSESDTIVSGVLYALDNTSRRLRTVGCNTTMSAVLRPENRSTSIGFDTTMSAVPM